MSILRPFKALRPTPQQVAEVAAVPYDVVNTEEAADLAKGHPLSFLRVSRSEIDLPAGTDPYAPQVYQKAQQNFAEVRAQAPLVVEDHPSVYVYRLKMGDHVQTGIAATWSVDEYDRDLIKKHERTRKDKEDDRTRHICTLRAQTGPVFLAYRDVPAIDALVAQETCQAPLFDFVAPDGIAHTMWRVTGTDALVQAFKAVAALYIADGHHRAASASRARASLRQEAGSAWTGQEDANFFLAVTFPQSQLRILPYHRLVKDLHGHSVDGFLERLRARVSVEKTSSDSPSGVGVVHMYLAGQWYKLGLLKAGEVVSDPAASLDVALLQDRVLSPLLGINDPRTDKRIDFVGGIRGPGSLRQAVDAGKAAVAFSMYPTSLGQLMSIADADQIMPPKSTWFEPKLRDAIVIHLI